MTFVRNLLSAFNLGHASFVGSSALMQLFPLLSAPIIARLYTPAEFGIYAIFFALSSILAGLSALALTNATLLEAEDVDAAHATLLAMSVTVVFCALLMVAVLATPHAVLAAMLGKAVVPYLPWLPLTALLSGVFTCLYTWAIRTKQFHLLARNRIVLGVSTAGLQIGIGLANPGAIGFILANLCGYGLAVMLLVAPFIGDLRRLRPSFGLRTGLMQLKKHRTLPLWTVPSNLVNSVCSYLPDLIIGRFFGVAQLGQFSLASRMVNFPLAFIATSAQDIFRQQASQEFQRARSLPSDVQSLLPADGDCCGRLVDPDHPGGALRVPDHLRQPVESVRRPDTGHRSVADREICFIAPELCLDHPGAPETRLSLAGGSADHQPDNLSGAAFDQARRFSIRGAVGLQRWRRGVVRLLPARFPTLRLQPVGRPLSRRNSGLIAKFIDLKFRTA